MNLEHIESIEDVYNRIQEILSIEKKFFPQVESKIQNQTKPEFLQELEQAQKDSKPSQELEQKSKEQKLSSSKTSTPFLSKSFIYQFIEREAQKKGLDPDLVKAIVKAESNFNPKAVSSKGAKGLMQLMPNTSEELGVRNPFDPIQNIKGGTNYLKELSRIFRNKDHIIAAYNAGPGAVKKYGGIPPYEETQNYVRKVNEFLEDFKEE